MRFLFQFLLIATVLFAVPTDAEAQFGNLKNKLKKTLNLKGKKNKDTNTNNSGSSSRSTSSRSTRSTDDNSSGNTSAPAEEVVETLSREATETDGVSSAIHEKYQNQIVFSNAPIKKRRENESAFITTAKLGTPIYYRVYMDNSLYNYMRNEPGTKDASIGGLKSRSSYKLSLLLNDKVIIEEARYYPALISDFKTKWTTFSGAFASKDPNYSYKVNVGRDGETTAIGIFKFKEFLTKAEHLMPKGEHKLTFQIQPMYSYRNKDLTYAPEIFSGDLTLIVADKVADPKNVEVCMPRGDMNDDRQLLEKVRQLYKARMGTLKQDISIETNVWEINRHKDTGIILDRWIRVIAGGDGEEGCFYKTHIFTQDYDGTGYGKMYIEKSHDKENRIPCSCLVDEY